MADSFPPPPPARPPYSKFTRSLDSALPLKAGKIEILENNSEVGESGSQIYVLIYSLIVVAAVMYLFYCVRDKCKYRMNLTCVGIFYFAINTSQ